MPGVKNVPLVIRTRATTSRRAGTIKRTRMQITHTFDYLRWNCAKILSAHLLTWRDIVAGQCCLLLANCNTSNCERGTRVHPSCCCGVAVIVTAVIISALVGNYPCNSGTCNGDISLNKSFWRDALGSITLSWCSKIYLWKELKFCWFYMARQNRYLFLKLNTFVCFLKN